MLNKFRVAQRTVTLTQPAQNEIAPDALGTAFFGTTCFFGFAFHDNLRLAGSAWLAAHRLSWNRWDGHRRLGNTIGDGLCPSIHAGKDLFYML